MPPESALSSQLHIVAAWKDRLRDLGLTEPRDFFERDDVRVWRDIAERQNAVLDLPDTRLHVKLMRAGQVQAMQNEVDGVALLERIGLATTPLVAHGATADGRSVLVTRDLAGHVPLDQIDVPNEFER